MEPLSFEMAAGYAGGIARFSFATGKLETLG